MSRARGSRPPSAPAPPLSLLLLLACCVGASLAVACARPAPPERLVALVVDLSGAEREGGLQLRDGARLALREAARVDETGPEVSLLVQDDRGDPARAARLARHLIEVPEVLAVITAAGGTLVGPALAEYAGAGEGMPVVVAGVCPPDVTRGREGVFCVAPGAEFLGETLAWFLVTELGADSAASFFTADALGQALDRGFAEELARLGGGLVERVPFDASVTSFDLFLPRATTAPVLLVAGRTEEAARAITVLRAAGVEAPILTNVQPREALPRLHHALLFDPRGHPPARAFAERFQAAFDRAPSAAAALGYDAAALVVRGAGAGAVARGALQEWLASPDGAARHEGGTGTFYFNRDHEAVRDVTIAGGSDRQPEAVRSAPRRGS
ncbi:MAG: ABC transporter substrate-binding protein, partial [Gemmatimonadota bacterium]